MNGNRKVKRGDAKAVYFAHFWQVPGVFDLNEIGSRLVTVATLNGMPMVTRQDETLGTIGNLVLDLDRGSIVYAIMVCGGFMGIGERQFAIDWKLLTLNAERQYFVFDVDMESVKIDLPDDKSQWPYSLFGRGKGDSS